MSQELKLIARIAENLPVMDSNIMQGWIENPRALKKVLGEALCPPEPARLWEERDSVIYITVISNGMTGKEWIKHFEEKGTQIGNYVRQLLLSKSFKPTNGKTYKIAVLKGDRFTDKARTTSNIRCAGQAMKFSTPNAEIACLIREMFTNEEIRKMDLYWIVTMHEPIKDSDDHPVLLSTDGHDDKSWLFAYYDRPDGRWGREVGFAFCLAS